MARSLCIVLCHKLSAIPHDFKSASSSGRANPVLRSVSTAKPAATGDPPLISPAIARRSPSAQSSLPSVEASNSKERDSSKRACATFLSSIISRSLRTWAMPCSMAGLHSAVVRALPGAMMSRLMQSLVIETASMLSAGVAQAGRPGESLRKRLTRPGMKDPLWAASMKYGQQQHHQQLGQCEKPRLLRLQGNYTIRERNNSSLPACYKTRPAHHSGAADVFHEDDQQLQFLPFLVRSFLDHVAHDIFHDI